NLFLATFHPRPLPPKTLYFPFRHTCPDFLLPRPALLHLPALFCLTFLPSTHPRRFSSFLFPEQNTAITITSHSTLVLNNANLNLAHQQPVLHTASIFLTLL
ncbi:hypothetical protein ACRALDRAFT_1049312, partial [Sodiomyces alcalophilus JCM 7366]|uniref:uncharacterized protein n=1 Tax=Sodiomyces alcalophilus JCM 7366 TaxID=591952 RepID=UPI0039B3EF3E